MNTGYVLKTENSQNTAVLFRIPIRKTYGATTYIIFTCVAAIIERITHHRRSLQKTRSSAFIYIYYTIYTESGLGRVIDISRRLCRRYHMRCPRSAFGGHGTRRELRLPIHTYSPTGFSGTRCCYTHMRVLLYATIIFQNEFCVLEKLA